MSRGIGAVGRASQEYAAARRKSGAGNAAPRQFGFISRRLIFVRHHFYSSKEERKISILGRLFWNNLEYEGKTGWKNRGRDTS